MFRPKIVSFDNRYSITPENVTRRDRSGAVETTLTSYNFVASSLTSSPSQVRFFSRSPLTFQVEIEKE